MTRSHKKEFVRATFQISFWSRAFSSVKDFPAWERGGNYILADLFFFWGSTEPTTDPSSEEINLFAAETNLTDETILHECYLDRTFVAGCSLPSLLALPPDIPTRPREGVIDPPIDWVSFYDPPKTWRWTQQKPVGIVDHN